MAETLAPEFIALQRALAGRYSFDRELGRGGMGIVFLARDVALDRQVAIKLLPPTMATQPGLRERFLREAQTAARLSHPNIIPIYQVEQQGDLVYFIMMYVEGETLGQRLHARGPLPVAQGVRMLQEVAWALAYAHARDIVHRDIKPDNILLDAATGRALVSDFGIARRIEVSGPSAVREIIGTAQYMSPEQAAGERVDGRSDLYSLGVVGFVALSGRLPFEAEDLPGLLAQHVTRPAPPLAAVAPGVPSRVAQAIDRCLSKAREARWATGEAFAEALAETTSVVRAVPTPIRVWLSRGEAARPVLWTWTIMVGGVAVVEALAALFGAGGGVGLNSLLLIGLPWGLYGVYRLYQTQRVIAAGYGLDDLKLALRHQIEPRREELAFEYDREPPLWARAIRWSAYAGLGVAAVSCALTLLPGWAPSSAWIATFGLGSLVAVGGAMVGRIFPGKRLEARDSSLEFKLRLMDARLGRWLHWLAGVGVKRAALPAGAHRPTELAIGMAADEIFASMLKDQRRKLKDLPPVLRQLEAHAQEMRARVDELNTMLAGIRGPSGDAPASLRADLEAQRDDAARRLAVSVAALENIRLDLLRLRAGVGTVDQLTADLAAVSEVHAEIERALDARREEESVL